MDHFDLITREFKLGDLDAIISMEQQSVPYPWNCSDFLAALQPKVGCDIIVATINHRAAAYAVIDVSKETVEIIKLIVDKDSRRKGVGTAVLTHIMEKVWGCQELVYHVRERDLMSQLFLKKHHLNATLIKGFFSNQNVAEYDGKAMPVYQEDSFRFSLPARTLSVENQIPLDKPTLDG